MRRPEHIEETIKDTFGLWISSLFSSIGSQNPTFSLAECRDAFFWLVEQLLRSGKIKFIAPNADCYVSAERPYPELTIQDEAAHWRDAPEDIVAQLRASWPQQVTDEADPELLTYFYNIPGIIWIADDGTLLAS